MPSFLEVSAMLQELVGSKIISITPCADDEDEPLFLFDSGRGLKIALGSADVWIEAGGEA